jgi:hypothetical protein
MKWQVKYALLNLNKDSNVERTQPIGDEAICISTHDQPDVLAVISDSDSISVELVKKYHENFPNLDFLCGYRKQCVWEGEAIRYLESERIGWGSAGTLSSALSDGNVNTAAHKDFFFSYRLINQMRSITNIVREFDRVLTITLANGNHLRVGMIMEYEPTADSIRTFWDRFGPIDIAWNINPNGNPTSNAIEAGQQLGCEVLKWESLKARI